MSSIKVIKPWECEIKGFEYYPGDKHGNEFLCLELVTTIMYGIEQGYGIPLVGMFRLKNGNGYELVSPLKGKFPEGGHHRTKSHILAQEPMGILLPDNPNDRVFLVEGELKGKRMTEIEHNDFDDIYLRSQPEVFAHKVKYDHYTVPRELIEPIRRPKGYEVDFFLEKREGRPITSSEIIQHLFM